MSASVFAALAVSAPGVPSTLAVGATTSAATAVPTNCQKVWFKSTVDTHIVFGASNVTNAVVASHQYLTADQDYVLHLYGYTHFKVIRGGADDGVLYYLAA